jgi:hypothetical protein
MRSMKSTIWQINYSESTLMGKQTRENLLLHRHIIEHTIELSHRLSVRHNE